LALLVLVIQDIRGSDVDPQSLWCTLLTICTTGFVDSKVVIWRSM